MRNFLLAVLAIASSCAFCQKLPVNYAKLVAEDDPLWDGQGCGPTSTCCTFNNPPWFCKQLPQSTNTDLEVRLCGASAYLGNTAIELIELYVKY